MRRLITLFFKKPSIIPHYPLFAPRSREKQIAPISGYIRNVIPILQNLYPACLWLMRPIIREDRRTEFANVGNLVGILNLLRLTEACEPPQELPVQSFCPDSIQIIPYAFSDTWRHRRSKGSQIQFLLAWVFDLARIALMNQLDVSWGLEWNPSKPKNISYQQITSVL